MTKPENSDAYNPWRDADRRHPDVHVAVCSTRPANGAWVPSLAVILIGDHLDATGRRCALAHELAHIDLAHGITVDAVLGQRQELAANRLAANRLLPLEVLKRALQRGLLSAESAEEFQVTPDLLSARLATLSSRERGELYAIADSLELVA